MNATWVLSHWIQIATFLGAWSAIASALNRVPKLTPDAATAPWKRGLHTLLIDWPAALPKVDFKGLFGLPVNVPFFTVSKAQEPPADPPRKSAAGRASLVVLLVIASLGIGCAFALAGCAPGTDGLRQACTNTDEVLTGGYQLVATYTREDFARIHSKIATQPLPAVRAELEAHAGVFTKTLAGLDSAKATMETICHLPDAIDAGAKRKSSDLIVQLLALADSARSTIATFMQAVQSWR